MKFLFLIIFINCLQIGNIKKGGGEQYLASLVTAKNKNPNLFVASQGPIIIPTGNSEPATNGGSVSVTSLDLEYPNDSLKLTVNKELPVAYMSPTVSDYYGLTYQIKPSLPSGITMNNQGMISGTPTATQNLTNYTVTISKGNSVGSYSFDLVIYGQYTYQDNGDGTVKQNETGLLWQKCTIGRSGSNCDVGSSIYYTRINAINACDSLTLAGKRWRLPKIDELMSLIKDNNNFSTFIDTIFFPSTANSNYWTQSVYQQSTNRYIYIDFSNGFLRSGSEDPGATYTRCVSDN